MNLFVNQTSFTCALLWRDNMLFSRKPYQIDSVYYMDNTLRIGCDCQAFSETLTGCKDCFKDAKGRITVSVFSPANNIISVRVLSHHAEPRTKGYSVIDLQPSSFGTLEDTGDYFTFKSGHRCLCKVICIAYKCKF